MRDDPDAWLREYGKRPHELAPFWFWYVADPGVAVDPHDYDAVLPPAVVPHMAERTTYPRCKTYASREAAVADFRRGFAAAVAAGWVPAAEPKPPTTPEGCP